MINKHGNNDKQATQKMLMKLDAPTEVINIVSSNILDDEDFNSKVIKPEEKIFIYSDHRVSPEGIVTLKERLSELNKRYLRNKGDTTKDLFSLYPHIVSNLYQLEEDILRNTNKLAFNLTSLSR